MAEARRGRGRPRKSGTSASQEPVQALDRALSLLHLIADEDGLALSELSRRLDIPAPTAHRLLTTLQSHRVTEFDESTQQWLVGVETFRMGSAFLRHTRIAEMGRHFMQELMEETGETVNLAIEQNGEVVFITQVETQEPIRAFFPPGTRGPVHTSGIGKALLAELPQRQLDAILNRKGLASFTPNTLNTRDALTNELTNIRKQGWAVDHEERNLGMRCVAAAIYNEFGEAIAGVSVSGPTVRISEDKIETLGPKVRACALRITESIGGVLPNREKKITDPFFGWPMQGDGEFI